ncbi:MAG: energy-coupling factor ABC transporter permease [Bacteroidetes bacterium]|nr:energy-coupling factor ABC transporter permease [Bacteroidota bacterium]MCL5025608.1 energy-coupling factor ABC transporter permease [Chloroflexota bacterium]
MHIAEGILPLTWAAANTAVALPFVLKGARDIKARAEAEPGVKPLMGLMGAAVFVVSALPIPVPISGTCSHPTGIGMAAILLKPLPAATITGVVLLFQALLMAHGGLTTWGANVFNMGVIGAFAGYGAFAALRRLGLPLWAGAAAAGALADLATYGGAALTLALALHGEQSVWTVWLAIFAAFMPTQVPLAFLEAAVTAGMVNFVVSRRPDIAARMGLAMWPRKEEVPGVA